MDMCSLVKERRTALHTGLDRNIKYKLLHAKEDALEFYSHHHSQPLVTECTISIHYNNTWLAVLCENAQASDAHVNHPTATETHALGHPCLMSLL